MSVEFSDLAEHRAVGSKRAPDLLSNDDLAEFRRIWQIDAAMLDRLRQLCPIIDDALDRLDERFYEPLFTEPPIRLLMRDPAVRRRAITAMAEHWGELLSGELKNETLLRAVQVGRRHLELGVNELYMVVASQHLLRHLIRAIVDAQVPDPAASIEAVVRMVRLSVSITMKSQAEAASHVASAEEVRRETRRLRHDMEELEEFAYVDALTGQFNRRHFDQALAAAIAHATRHAEPLCLIMADIDRFKRVNDLRGHLAGDRVLRSLAAAMADLVRRDDVLVRFGGEEFAVILPTTTIDEANMCAERIRSTVEALPIAIEPGDPMHVTLSLGVAAFIGTETAEDLVSAADVALYRAKQLGRNRVETRAAEPAQGQSPQPSLISASFSE